MLTHLSRTLANLTSRSIPRALEATGSSTLETLLFLSTKSLPRTLKAQPSFPACPASSLTTTCTLS